MIKLKNLIKDTSGDAIVEAAILFPIIIMVFAALFLLSLYLPIRASLQRATQYAATAIATEQSDTWLYYDDDNLSYEWHSDKDELDNVYLSVLKSFNMGYNPEERVTEIVRALDEKSITSRMGELTVDCAYVNYIVYKHLTVTAKRVIPVAELVDLSFIGFPEEITIAVTSRAVVQDGDEFTRNVDIAVDFVAYLDEKYDLNLEEAFSGIDTVREFLGWQ